MRHTRCALGTGVQSCALPIYRLFSSGDRRLQHLAPPQFRRRADALLILPGPEQRCGRNVDPFEALVDAIEVGGDIVADLGRELVDEEGAAGAQGFGRRSEEHTSELQSLMRISYAVFCLNKNKKTHKQRPKV